MIQRKPRIMRPERWRQVEQLYHAASEREPGERGAFLQEACQGDDQLKSEVESLLRQEASEEGLLGWGPPPDLSADLVPGLSPGEELGPYKIIGAIGSGGMGEVYRAFDTQLEREVAVKALPRALANDPERLGRFEREAKVLAALSHPNIAVIYGLAEARGQRALVMELVPGETLGAVIKKRRAMPFAAVAPIARQVAEALEAAHEKGIVHRDLKPGNVMVTPAGLVKVLDFGLAAMAQGGSTAVAAADACDSLGPSIGRTLAGTILGTAAYISPEQAAGLPVDKRSDIWSYGAVLWEMLTGKRVFEGGKTLSQTLADVLHSEIDFRKLPGTVPPAIVELLGRCLDRDVTTRLRDIGEARVAIARCVADPARGSVAAPHAQGRSAKLSWVLAAVGLVAAAILGFLHFREAAPETLVVQTTILPPEKTTFDFVNNGPMQLSPDGRRMVFAATAEDGKSQLWIRTLDAATAQPLLGTRGGRLPFWAPDSRWVGFFADGALKKVDTQSGIVIPLAGAASPNGGAWSPKGMIVFSPIGPSVLLKVSSSGGNPVPATEVGGGRFPWLLPDGEHFLFTTLKPPRRVNLVVGSLRSTSSKIVGEAQSNAVYAEGRLLYRRGNALMAQPFDIKALQTTGEAVQIAQGVEWYGTMSVFSVSATGLLAYQLGNGIERGGLQLTWFDRTGKPLGTVGEHQFGFGSLELSPNRRRLVTSSEGDLWRYDLPGGSRTRFTFDPAFEWNAVWSNDGQTVVFNSARKGHLDLYRKSANGSGDEELLYADNQAKLPTSWSPDGKLLLYHTFAGSQGVHLWVLPMTADRPGVPPKPRRLLEGRFSDAFGQFSPDGRWVLYGSIDNESIPQYEIYVSPLSRPAEKHQISANGGVRPRWRPDGKEIFYHTRNDELVAVDVRISGNSAEVGARHPLFGGIPPASGYAWDISADGQRILAAVPVKQTPPEPITLVQNWAPGLKK